MDLSSETSQQTTEPGTSWRSVREKKRTGSDKAVIKLLATEVQTAQEEVEKNKLRMNRAVILKFDEEKAVKSGDFAKKKLQNKLKET